MKRGNTMKTKMLKRSNQSILNNKQRNINTSKNLSDKEIRCLAWRFVFSMF